MLAQSGGISDNNWLDQFRIPVGEWFTQTVDWVDANLGGLLAVIRWPFSFLFDVLMSDNPNRDSIMSVSWVWVVLGFFILGSVLRNTRIGLMAAVMVAACGILGQDFWFQTSKTFGMLFVSVLLCTLVGLPLGIACGRSDGVWNVTRPVLDAMQVVHSFVWMLPFIAFWGIGEVSATMVTMMFALPPLVRLTNLGIRQVPEDVVEAARSYGSTERRVLTDVQLPLARPAIMTGLNQTLLLAISMLGIAALMGADGLGKLIFRAINNLDTGLAFSSGLAFFLVAVVLDRISQPEADDGLSLFGRIGQAWRYRAEPQALLDAQGVSPATEAGAATPEPEPAERPVPLGATERTGLLAVLVGSVVAIVGTILPWVSDAGVISAWGRAADESLAGQTFSGLEGSGGNFFGILIVVMSVIAILSALRPLLPSSMGRLSLSLNRAQGALLALLSGLIVLIFVLNIAGVDFQAVESFALAVFVAMVGLIAVDAFVRGMPRLGPDGALMASIGALALSVGFLFAQAPAQADQFSTGIGIWVALAGAAVAVGGGLAALFNAPYQSQRPLPTSASYGTAFGAAFGLLIVFGGAVAAWVVDEREGFRNRVFFGGIADDGPGLGWPTLLFAALALVGALFVSGVFGLQGQRRWHWGTITTGLGMGAVLIPAAFTLSISRTGDTDYFNDRNALTGAGILLAMAGAFVLVAIGRSAIKEFRRRKIYADATSARVAALADDGDDFIGDAEAVLEGSRS